MRVIRNFFHNISDVLLAIIVVALAAGIIYWRMQMILDYPKQAAAAQAKAAYEQQDKEAQEAAEESEDAEAGEDEGSEAGDAEE